MMSVESTGVQTSPRGNSSVWQRQKYESSMPGPLTRNACLRNSTSMAGWHALLDEVVFHTLGKLVLFLKCFSMHFPRLQGLEDLICTGTSIMCQEGITCSQVSTDVVLKQKSIPRFECKVETLTLTMCVCVCVCVCVAVCVLLQTCAMQCQDLNRCLYIMENAH